MRKYVTPIGRLVTVRLRKGKDNGKVTFTT